jgi:anaerobic ribonucleoside-triphosphate reductase activating protein
MEIHATLSRSSVNGPGPRAVIWFQGCTLDCRGCWNPETHPAGIKPQQTIEEVGSWVLSCTDIDGVTFSGGEPFQQAVELLLLCEFLKRRHPTLSLGLFSGYTVHELSAGRWTYRHQGQSGIPGSAELYQQITRHLDFGVFGRFTQAQASRDVPLCGSRNQQVEFFNTRYSAADLSPQACEIFISSDGDEIAMSGFPAAPLVQILRA